jgi:hypothetical protein
MVTASNAVAAVKAGVGVTSTFSGRLLLAFALF